MIENTYSQTSFKAKVDFYLSTPKKRLKHIQSMFSAGTSSFSNYRLHCSSGSDNKHDVLTLTDTKGHIKQSMLVDKLSKKLGNLDDGVIVRQLLAAFECLKFLETNESNIINLQQIIRVNNKKINNFEPLVSEYFLKGDWFKAKHYEFMSYTASNAINRAQRSLQSHEDMLNKIINKYHKIFPEITKVDIY